MTDDQDRPDPSTEPTDETAPPSAPAPVEEIHAGSPIPWRVALVLLIGAAVVVFSVQNTQSVEMRFLGWDWDMPLVIVILVTIVVSVLADEVIGGIVRRRRVKRRRERDELRRLRDIS